MTDTIARRLPHVVTRADLAIVLTPTYSEAMSVDEDEAAERLARALQHPQLVAELHAAIAEALLAHRGPRTTEDALVDKLSKGVQARRARVKAAPEDPGISAVMVRINLEIGLAPDTMRATLESERGRVVLQAGWRKLGAHLANELLR